MEFTLFILWFWTSAEIQFRIDQEDLMNTITDFYGENFLKKKPTEIFDFASVK
jgi:hypothetical protein